jgi:hypothetical protein
MGLLAKPCFPNGSHRPKKVSGTLFVAAARRVLFAVAPMFDAPV